MKRCTITGVPQKVYQYGCTRNQCAILANSNKFFCISWCSMQIIDHLFIQYTFYGTPFVVHLFCKNSRFLLLMPQQTILAPFAAIKPQGKTLPSPSAQILRLLGKGTTFSYIIKNMSLHSKDSWVVLLYIGSTFVHLRWTNFNEIACNLLPYNK